MADLDKYLVGDSPYNQGFALRYSDGDYSLEAYPRDIPFSINDIQHTVIEGETLQNIAYKYYRDSGKWYIISDANGIFNPLTEVVPGLILRIPYYGSTV